MRIRKLWALAFALALVEDPASSGFLIGHKVVHPRAFDIGVAVQVEDGVVVPVLRKVDQKTLPQLTNEYAEMVERGRRRRLSEDDLRGGIATVTNFGTFGLTSGTPIPLPNETLILGLGAGEAGLERDANSDASVRLRSSVSPVRPFPPSSPSRGQSA